jgi:hypothetical protein
LSANKAESGAPCSVSICLLDAQLHPEELDIVDSPSHFLQLVKIVDPHLEEEEVLLRKPSKNVCETWSDWRTAD